VLRSADWSPDFLRAYEASAWYGLAAPKGTPPEIVDRLNKAVK